MMLLNSSILAHLRPTLGLEFPIINEKIASYKRDLLISLVGNSSEAILIILSF